MNAANPQSKNKTIVLISYDISDDRIRARLAKSLKDFGHRVQKSVFEAEITAAEMAKLKKRLARVKLDADDSIRLYVLCKACCKSAQIWGSGELTRDPKVIIL